MRALHRTRELRRRRKRPHKVRIQRDRVRLDLIQQALDLALPPRALVLKRIGLGAVEVGLARAGDEDARHACGVPDGEDVLEGAEAEGGQGTVRDGMGEI